MRAATKTRAGHRCEAAEIVPEIECWGRLETDEIASRGIHPGGHLDLGNTQALCSAHHRWRTENPAQARERGLRIAAADLHIDVTTPKHDRPSPSLRRDVATIRPPRPLQGGRGRLQTGVVCRGTLGRMCASVVFITGDEQEYGSIQQMLDAGIVIDADLITRAVTDPEDGERFDTDSCFCVVDVDAVLDGLGLRHADDPITGNRLVTSPHP